MGDLNNGATTSKNSKSSFQTNINIYSDQLVSQKLNETIDKPQSNQNPQEIENLDFIFEFLNDKLSILTSSSSESEQDEDNYINETTFCDQTFFFFEHVLLSGLSTLIFHKTH